MDAALAGFIEAKQVEDETTDDGEIGAGIFLAGAHLIVVERDIEAPVKAIFDAPVRTHGRCQRRASGAMLPMFDREK